MVNRNLKWFTTYLVSRIFQNMQFKYGGVFLWRKITISSIIQVSYVAIFLGYLKLVWCLLLDFLGSLIYTTGQFSTKKSHLPTGPTQLVQVLYIIELSAKMGIFIVMFAYWRVKVGTWTPVLRYISWMSVLIGESSFSGVKVSVVIFCANLPTFVEYPKKQQILYGYFLLADVSSSFFSIKLLQILKIFFNRWNPWINPPKTTNLASIHLKSPRLWDISPLFFGFTNIARQQRWGSHVRGLRLRRVPRRRWGRRGDGGGAHDVQPRLSDAWGTAGSDGRTM